ncbi:YqzL family protein [Caldalkalibacillus mannanilyticus]|nr:YqzL family protein [Caldalkalibacillus mannanilyticus]
MREFSWNVFAVTGNIEAYLLYRECEGPNCQEEDENLQMTEEQSEMN